MDNCDNYKFCFDKMCFICHKSNCELFSIYETKLEQPSSHRQVLSGTQQEDFVIAEFFAKICTKYKIIHNVYEASIQLLCGNCVKTTQTTFKFIQKIKDAYFKTKPCELQPKHFDKSTQTSIDSNGISGPFRRHKSTTLLEQPTCEYCWKSFSRNDHLKRHIRTVHKKKIESSILEEPEIAIEVKNNNMIFHNNLIESTSISDDDITKIDKSKLNNFNPLCIDKENPMIIQTITGDTKKLDIKVKPEELMFLVSNINYNSRTKEGDNLTCFHNISENSKDPTKFFTNNLHEAMHPLTVSTLSRPVGNQCLLCEKKFSRNSHLQRHLLIHSSEKPHVCVHCGKKFSRSDHLQKHINSLHKKKEHCCKLCSHAFIYEKDLLFHIKTKHENINKNEKKMYKCDQCDKMFVTKSYMIRHKAGHLKNNFYCKICEEGFVDRKQFREHEKLHCNKRNFLCSICGESFLRKDYLVVHLRRHTGDKPYKCQFCGKGFPRATDVKMHERYHTGTKPNLCTQCGKRFHRPFNLTIHLRTHTGERPYKCHQCPKTFTQSNDLKTHIRRHTGEKFKCKYCDANFLQLYILRRHTLSVHGIQMIPTTGRLQKYDKA